MVDPASSVKTVNVCWWLILAVIPDEIYRILPIVRGGMFCDYARAVIDIRQVEGEGDRRNASRNRSNRAGTSLLFSFGQLAFLKCFQSNLQIYHASRDLRLCARR
jgi:hypothetical protein